jgi:hypothetical protein
MINQYQNLNSKTKKKILMTYFKGFSMKSNIFYKIEPKKFLGNLI